MDLVHQVAANLEIEAGKAEKGIGAILMALRMNLDGETFKKVKHVLPNSESLMGRALMGGARTGEMAALIGPAGLLAALAAAGYLERRYPAPGAHRARAPAARHREGQARGVPANRTGVAVGHPPSPPQSRHPTWRSHVSISRCRAAQSAGGRSRHRTRAIAQRRRHRS